MSAPLTIIHKIRLVASEASHITHEVFGEIRAGGSSLARPHADFLVNVIFLCSLSVYGGCRGSINTEIPCASQFVLDPR